jgi:hypothetical protein
VRAPLLVLLTAAVGCSPQPERRAAPVAPPSASASAAASASVAPSASATPPPPAAAWQLACLAKHYDARVDGDAVVTPAGERVPLHAPGRTFEARLDAPSAEDVFLPRYPRGAIAPVTDPEADPGRFRPLPLLRAVYGATPAAIEKALVTVDFVGTKIRVHRRARPAFEAAAGRLEAAVAKDPSLKPFFDQMGGTYNYRPIAGTDRLSAHAFGIALDVSTARSHYWRSDGAKIVWKNSIPQAIVDAFEASGFVWGGRWYHYDTMHFEWRPEIFDPECGAMK